jgi:hypothetical protein
VPCSVVVVVVVVFCFSAQAESAKIKLAAKASLLGCLLNFILAFQFIINLYQKI